MDTDYKNYNFKKIRNFKHGENPHQKASLYNFDKELNYEILKGSELTFNDIINATCAIEISGEFFDVASCVIIKYANPCAVALASNIEGAFDKVLDADPISLFGGICSFTRKVELPLAKKISAISPEIIIAPNYSDEAITEFEKNKNLKIIKLNTPFDQILNFQNEEIKLTPFGALVQEKNTACLDVNTFKVISKKKPEQSELEDMIFAFKVVKHVKSGAIVVAKNLRTLGICAGQPNSATSVEFALQKVCDSPKDSIIASDDAFSSTDNIQIAAQNRVSGIIQPAGTIKDKEIIECANKLNICMVATGIRHVKH